MRQRGDTEMQPTCNVVILNMNKRRKKERPIIQRTSQLEEGEQQLGGLRHNSIYEHELAVRHETVYSGSYLDNMPVG